MNYRIGLGFDVHRLIKAKKALVLGGVKIPSPFSLKAVSDGDVVLHTVSDALCGAANLAYPADFTNKLTIKNTGKVGIGTTNPAYLLDVDHPTANSNVARIKPKVGSGDIEVLTLQSGNGDPILTARNTGNVGIGTTSPNVNLDARGVVALGNTGNRFVVGQRLISGQKGVWFTVDDVASNVAGIQAENAGTGYFSMALQPFGGNVGIGTADPTQKLTVRGTLRLTDGSYNGDLTMRSEE